jgi:hypothetical protein
MEVTPMRFSLNMAILAILHGVGLAALPSVEPGTFWRLAIKDGSMDVLRNKVTGAVFFSPALYDTAAVVLMGGTVACGVLAALGLVVAAMTGVIGKTEKPTLLEVASK